MKTCLLIPTAGKGKRFLRKKYKTYKPFLKIIKKEMIQYIFDNNNRLIRILPFHPS